MAILAPFQVCREMKKLKIAVQNSWAKLTRAPEAKLCEEDQVRVPLDSSSGNTSSTRTTRWENLK